MYLTIQLDDFRDKYSLWDCHHNLCGEYILHLQKLSPILLFIYLFCDKNI